VIRKYHENEKQLQEAEVLAHSQQH